MAIDVNGDGVVDESDLTAPINPSSAEEFYEWTSDEWMRLIGATVDDPTGLEQSSYDFTYRVFPSDLTMQDNAHYMVININVPVNMEGNPRSELPVGTVLANEFSKVDNLRFNKAFADLPGQQGGTLSIPRYTRRIAQSIALHMPNGGLVYTEDNKYEEVSMTAMASGLVGAAARIAGDNIGGKALNLVNAIGSGVSNASKLAGYPINPRVEVLFATRPQRQWMFEMFLAPRNPTEAKTAAQIIKTLRYHAAPELGVGGFYFIPPAEFDITFYRQGVENTKLPRINTCVLERIDIDYAPQSGLFTTFKDGYPVAVRLSLGFREIEILHKRRVLQGF